MVQLAGRSVKPSDILALRNNIKSNNRYKSAAYPEPGSINDSTSGINIVQQQHSTHQASTTNVALSAIGVIANDSPTAIHAQTTNNSQSNNNKLVSTTTAINIMKNNSNNSVNSAASSPLTVANMDANIAAMTQPPTPPPHHSNSSNIVSTNNSTNKTVINQSSSASRKKNRRIGRHESRYTSGNILFI